MERAERSRLTAGFVGLLAVAGIAVLSIAAVSPPAPVASTAPADQFSSERAFQHIERIASAVHPTGSPAADDVRQYVTSTLTGLGLPTRVQDDVGASEPYNYARVRNVVAVLKGDAPTGKVFLFAHYDSATASYAASDDGVGVAVLLEVARALTAQARPANDIVFVITDGEESCLCGAEAFAKNDPDAAEGGVLLNFDDRGDSGPGIMYRTSPGNSALIAAYQDAVPYPWASSFAGEVNRRLPGDTDFSPLMESGKFTGFDTALIDGSAVYHTPQDKPEYIDHSSIQHTGANALALSRALASTDLGPLRDRSGPDATYFPALSVLVSYPAWLVWPLAGLAVAAVIGLAWLARRRKLTSWPRMAAGLGLTLLPLLLGPAAAQLLWITLVAMRPGYTNMLDPWWPGWFRSCLAGLVVAIVLAWYGLFRRRIGPWALLIAGIAVLVILGVALAALAPSGSYLVALPGLAGAVGCIIAILVRRPVLQLVAQFAGAAVGIIILAPMVTALFAAVGLTRAAAPGFVVVLVALSILPVLDWVYPAVPDQQTTDPATVRSAGHRRRWWTAAPALLAVALAGTFLATGLGVDHFDATHPAPVQLNYILDADTGQARWFSTDENPDPWVTRYVTGQPNSHAEFWPLDDGVPTGPAPAAHLPAPTVTTLSDTASDDRRTLTVSITPQRTSNRLWLALPDTSPTRVTVDGRDVPLTESEDDFFLAFYGAPAAGIIVKFELSGTDPVKLRVGDNSQGLDNVPGYVTRPDDLGLVGADGSDIVTVARTYTL